MVDATHIGSLEAQLQATLDKIPAYTWYANPTVGLAQGGNRGLLASISLELLVGF